MPQAKEFAAQGVEIVRADLDDVESLKKAFDGANIIFTVTNYWEPFFRPDCGRKHKTGHFMQEVCIRRRISTWQKHGRRRCYSG